MPISPNHQPRSHTEQNERKRYDRNAALEMLGRMPLGELMGLAHRARVRHQPGGLVTFVVDTNPNYTNICVTGCDFCAFYKRAGDAEAYTLSPQALAARVAEAYERGATTVLLQGGHNPRIGLKEWLTYIRTIRAACP